MGDDARVQLEGMPGQYEISTWGPLISTTSQPSPNFESHQYSLTFLRLPDLDFFNSIGRMPSSGSIEAVIRIAILTNVSRQLDTGRSMFPI